MNIREIWTKQLHQIKGRYRQTAKSFTAYVIGEPDAGAAVDVARERVPAIDILSATSIAINQDDTDCFILLRGYEELPAPPPPEFVETEAQNKIIAEVLAMVDDGGRQMLEMISDNFNSLDSSDAKEAVEYLLSVVRILAPLDSALKVAKTPAQYGTIRDAVERLNLYLQERIRTLDPIPATLPEPEPLPVVVADNDGEPEPRPLIDPDDVPF